MKHKEGENRELFAQRNRVSDQGACDGLGGKLPEGERAYHLFEDASAIGRRVEGRVRESTRVRDKEAESQAGITDYAKKNGVWDSDIESTSDAHWGTEEGQKNTDGGEAVVWFDCDRRLAIKAIGLDYYGSPMLALERVELHNRYFPNTAMTLVGFGEIPDVVNAEGEVELYGRSFNIIVEQALIDRTEELTKDEIKSRLEAQGFKFLKDSGEAGLDMETPDGRAVVSDLHERNVLGTSNGSIAVIDCDIRYKE